MAVDQPHLAAFDSGVGMVQISPALAEALYFRSLEHQAALQTLKKVELARGLFVPTNDLR